PQLVKAKKSVAAFKLRAGQIVGIKTTLRGRRMWYFLDKLLNVALPRIRDFRGVSPDGFDGRGNYSLGLREQVVFPEIDYDKIDKLRGLEVSIVTTAQDPERRPGGDRQRSHRGHAHAHPQLQRGAPSRGEGSGVQAQARDRSRPEGRGLHRGLRRGGGRLDADDAYHLQVPSRSHPGDLGCEEDQPPRTARLRAQDRDPESPRWARDRHPQHC